MDEYIVHTSWLILTHSNVNCRLLLISLQANIPLPECFGYLYIIITLVLILMYFSDDEEGNNNSGAFFLTFYTLVSCLKLPPGPWSFGDVMMLFSRAKRVAMPYALSCFERLNWWCREILCAYYNSSSIQLKFMTN